MNIQFQESKMILFHVCFALLLILLVDKSSGSERIACNETYEFLCKSDNSCIPKTSVCNFVKDCTNGDDEARCGSCNFEEEPERCGLTFEADQPFAWQRKRPFNNADMKDLAGVTANNPEYYMYLRLNYYLHKNKGSQVVHQVRVFFPHLRPTNNEQCRFEFKMRLTDKPARIPGIIANSSWPEVSMSLLQPKANTNEFSPNLADQANRIRETKEISYRTSNDKDRLTWRSHEFAIGRRRTVWTLEMVFRLKIHSYLVHTGSFRYVDCEPDELEPQFEVNTSAPLEHLENCDEIGKFKCVRSGLCIDKSLVCDFGFDCGDDDESDELFCDSYQGRCNFEDDIGCDWSFSPENSWYPVALPVVQSAQPKMDHTFLSPSAGHYMLLNTKTLEPGKMHRFIGPKVVVRDSGKECRFRFWLSIPENLSNLSITTPKLQIGSNLIGFKSLMNADSKRTNYERTKVWRRFDHLIDYSFLNSVYIQLSFGAFSTRDLKIFTENGGYVALDDFSFSPGCHLTFEGDNVDYCGEHEFFCEVPVPNTNVNCIPIEYYCDFKNDCGSRSRSELWTSDERDCPHKCEFKRGERCIYQLTTGLSLKTSGEVEEDEKVNEAFSARVVESDVGGGLVIDSMVDEFLEKYKKQSTDILNLNNMEITLPQFSQAHGYCMFELTYRWSDDAENIFASISISSQNVMSAILLKRLEPRESNRNETVLFGLGPQRGRFNLMIEVSFSGGLIENSLRHTGSLHIHSYNFRNCSFASGFIKSTNEAEFQDPPDEYDDNDIPTSEFPIDEHCGSGFFQCRNPILCIPMDFVCDLQVDCQGGTDEFPAECANHHMFNFDQEFEDEALKGWQQSASGILEWSLMSARDQTIAHSRAFLDSGPAYDHTKSGDEGKFLLVSGPEGRVASLYSPRFTVSTADTCRVVFYLYFWGRNTNRFEVLRQNYGPEAESKSLFKVDGQREQQVDAWQRVSLALEESAEFALIFNGYSGKGSADLITLDDISFSSGCLLSANQTRLKPELESESESAARKPEDEACAASVGSCAAANPINYYWMVGTLVLIVLVIAGIGIEANNLRRLFRRNNETSAPVYMALNNLRSA